MTTKSRVNRVTLADARRELEDAAVSFTASFLTDVPCHEERRKLRAAAIGYVKAVRASPRREAVL